MILKIPSVDKNNTFIKFNSHGKAFIRVKYNDELLNKLLENINNLSTPDKSTLLSDTSSFFKSGIVKHD